MILQNLIKNAIGSTNVNLLNNSDALLASFRKECKSLPEITQFIQLKTMLEIKSDFVYILYKSVKDGNYCETIDKLSMFFDNNNISSQIYGYYFFEILNGCGISTDKVEWVDPLKDTLDEQSKPIYNKSFGKGTFTDSINDFGIKKDSILKYKGKSSIVTIPYGINTILEEAFLETKNMKILSIPDSVNFIQASAFSNCPELSVVFNYSKSTVIPEKCFYGDVKFESLIMHEVSEIGNKAFSGTQFANFSKLAYKGLKKVGAFAFSNCYKLKEIDLNKVTSIGKGAFAHCKNIKLLKMSDCTLVEDNRLLELFAKDEMDYVNSEISVEEVVYECTNKIIPDFFFAGCSSVSRINIIGEVESIGKGAFENCTALKNLEMDFVGKELSDEVFCNCKNLDTISDFNNVNKIGTRCFEGCSKLNEINFKKNILFVGECAFSGCSSLKNLSINFENCEINSKCFDGCVELNNISLENVKTIKKFAFANNKFPNGLLVANDVIIEEGAFSNAEIDGNLEISNGAIIDELAFENVIGIENLIVGSMTFKTTAGNDIKCYQLFAKNINDFNNNFKSIENIKVCADSIEPGAFENWKNIKKVVLDSGIECIEKNAFADCSSLQAVKVNSSKISIMPSAFANCTMLKKFISKGNNFVDFDLSSVFSIGRDAFSNCSIESISIPLSCSIKKNAFSRCRNLKEIAFYSDDTNKINDIYTFFADNVEDFNNNFKNCSKVHIYNCKELPDRFFSGYKNIKEIIFHSDIEDLGSSCFTNMADLEKISGNYVGTVIKESMFENCTKLTSIFSMNNVEEIGNSAFYNCSSLTEIICNKVITIGDSAFKDCSMLKLIDTDGNLLKIGAFSFSGCKNIVNYSFVSKVEEIQKYAFENSSIDFIPGSVKVIHFGAFDNTKFSNGLKIRDGIKISKSAFRNVNLNNEPLVFDNVKIFDVDNNPVLPYELFESNITDFENKYEEMTKLKINSELFEDAFKDWKQVKKVIVNSGKNCVIPKSCFKNCIKLEKIKISSDDVTIEDNAFENCYSLTSFKTNKTFVSDEEFYLKDIKYIGNSAFANCDKINKLSISLGNVAVGAFAGCRDISELKVWLSDFAEGNIYPLLSIFGDLNNESVISEYDKIKSLEVYESNNIPENFLCGCKRLEKVFFQGEINSIGKASFKGCDNLTTLAMSYMGTTIASDCFNGCSSLIGPLVFDNVTNIESRAFKNCSNLVCVAIQSKVSEIGEEAFTNCRNIKTIDIGFTGTTIGDNCFSNCTELTIPPRMENVISISPSAFFNCKKITSLTIGKLKDSKINSVFKDSYMNIQKIKYNSKYIPMGYFEGMTSLKNVEFMEDIKSIDDNAFYGTSELNTLPIMYSVESIGNYAFAYSGVNELLFSNSLSHIGIGAFVHCDKLKSLTIPSNFKLFGSMFDWKSGLESKEIIQMIKGRKRQYYIPKSLSEVNIIGGKLSEGIFSGLNINVNISSEIEDIPDDSFYNLSGNLTIDLSKCKHIGKNAFSNVTFTIPKIDLCEINEIEDFAFAGVKADCISIGDNINKIANNAFENSFINCIEVNSEDYYICNDMLIDKNTNSIIFVNKNITSIKNIPENINDINSYVFNNCKNLTSINIDNIETISKGAFNNCSNISEVYISEKVKCIGENIFEGCETISTINIPFLGNNIDSPSSLRYILGNSKIHEGLKLTINGGRLYDGLFNFDNSVKFDLIDISKVDCEVINEGTFRNVEINRLCLPDNLLEIKDGAFDCVKINKISFNKNEIINDKEESEVVSESAEVVTKEEVAVTEANADDAEIADTENNTDNVKVENIEDKAEVTDQKDDTVCEDNADQLKVSKIFITKDCIYSGEELIYRYKNTDVLNIFEGTKFISYNALSTNNIAQELVINNSEVFDIQNRDSISNIKGFSKLVINADVDDKIKELFKDNYNNIMNITYTGESSCEGMFSELDSLESIYIPNVKVIYGYMFYNCKKLRNFDTFKNLEEIRTNSFAGLKPLQKLVIPGTIKNIDESIFDTPIDSLDIAENDNYRYNNKILNDKLGRIIYVEKDIEGDVVLDENITSIRKNSFANCNKIRSIKIGVIDKIEDRAFENCSNLTEFVLNDCREYIGNGILNKCNSLSKLTVPFIGKSVDDNSVLAYLFTKNNDELTNTNNIPNSLTSVKITKQKSYKETFNDCKNLSNISLCVVAENISKYTFRNCIHLKNISIPKTVETIEKFAFAGCDNSLEIELETKKQETKFDKKWKYLTNGFFGICIHKAKVNYRG